MPPAKAECCAPVRQSGVAQPQSSDADGHEAAGVGKAGGGKGEQGDASVLSGNSRRRAARCGPAARPRAHPNRQADERAEHELVTDQAKGGGDLISKQASEATRVTRMISSGSLNDAAASSAARSRGRNASRRSTENTAAVSVEDRAEQYGNAHVQVHEPVRTGRDDGHADGHPTAARTNRHRGSDGRPAGA
jgi:hypothetical protein